MPEARYGKNIQTRRTVVDDCSKSVFRQTISHHDAIFVSSCHHTLLFDGNLYSIGMLVRFSMLHEPSIRCTPRRDNPDWPSSVCKFQGGPGHEVPVPLGEK
jgi:hypothetical protein